MFMWNQLVYLLACKRYSLNCREAVMLTELEVIFFSIVDYKLERISSFGALSSRCENSLGLPFPYVHYGVKKRVISFFFFF